MVKNSESTESNAAFTTFPFVFNCDTIHLVRFCWDRMKYVARLLAQTDYAQCFLYANCDTQREPCRESRLWPLLQQWWHQLVQKNTIVCCSERATVRPKHSFSLSRPVNISLYHCHKTERRLPLWALKNISWSRTPSAKNLSVWLVLFLVLLPLSNYN